MKLLRFHFLFEPRFIAGEEERFDAAVFGERKFRSGDHISRSVVSSHGIESNSHQPVYLPAAGRQG